MKFFKPKGASKSNFDIQTPELFEKHVGHFETSYQINFHRFYLDKNIESPSNYQELIQTLLTAGEHDTIELFVSNYGGNLDSAVNIMSAIEESNATVRAVIGQNCASAASVIALSCDVITVINFATMMIHNISYGAGGKASDVSSQVIFMQDYFKELVHYIYQDYLTDKEIQEVLAGKEIWMGAQEIEQRLQNREKAREKQEKKAISMIKKATKVVEKQEKEIGAEITEKVVDKSKKD